MTLPKEDSLSPLLFTSGWSEVGNVVFTSNLLRQSCYLIYLHQMINRFTDPPGPPSAPEPTDITKESCELTWKAPENDGGSPIIGYFIERAQTGSSRWLRCNKEPVSDKTYKVTDLIEDNEYVFRIVAVNKVGEGPPGPLSANVKAKDPWGKLNMHIQIVCSCLGKTLE